MKKYIVTIAVSAACFFTVSCKKDISLDPLIFQPTTFSTEAQLEAQLAAVYGNFNIEQLYAQGLWGYFASGADEGFRIDAATGTAPQVITETYRGASADATYANFWRGCYKGIEQANIIIENIDVPSMSAAKRKSMLGQAIFMRAYFHYLLASHFGDVVLKTVPTTQLGTNFRVLKTPRKEVYDFVLREMRQADTMVAPITQVGHTSIVTQTAVEAILARVCLTMAGNPINDASKYQEALFWANKVIASGAHRLNATPLAIYSNFPSTPNVPAPPAYSNVFTNNMQNNVTYSATNAEGIWDAAFLSKSNVTGPYSNTGFIVTQQLGALMGITNNTLSGSFGQSNINTFGFSTGTYRSFARLYNLYEPGDLRRDWNISPYLFNGNTNGRAPILSVVITGGGGTGATATARVSNGNRITSITIDNGGSGYTTAPTISFVSTAGSGATATAVVTAGRVTAINIVNQGSGYPTSYDRPIGKWRREYETNLGGVTRLNNLTSCNFPIIRYADVLLMAAEADLQINGGTPSAQAVEFYNQVRRRAFGAANPTLPMPGVDVATFTMQDIMDERSRELCFEGVRRLDLIRWGTFTQVMQNIVTSNNANAPGSLLAAANFTANNFVNNPVKFSLFPIPASEIIANNLLTQNPGW